MSKLLAIAAFVASFAFIGTASEGWTECASVLPDSKHLPHEPTGAVRICRSGVLAISYDVEMINPALSMYYITPEQARNLLPGRLSFYADPDLTAMGVVQASTKSDAFSQDWNRGHLAPNHIMSFSDVGKKACFSMANIAPQAGYFNQQPWNKLEGKIADWIASNEALHIVTGVAYHDRKKATRTSDNIAVPDIFWKVLCAPDSRESVAFYGYNNLTTKTTVDFVTVKDVEEIYGGSIIPSTLCNIAAVNRTHWWN